MSSRIEREVTDILRCELIAQGVPDADQYRVEFVAEGSYLPAPPPVDPAEREAVFRWLAARFDLPPEWLT